MLGRFLCLAKFDFSDRIDTRIDSIRSSILNENLFLSRGESMRIT